MKTLSVCLLLLCGCCFPVLSQESATFADTISMRFAEQQSVFPQEKMYLHTDKPVYIAGEDIWFRVHLVDYVTHLPDTTSRYVYAELVNPVDSVVGRVKIRHENGCYKGYIPLSEEIAEGVYQLRCYTRFMEGIGEDYFFRRKVTIGGALSAHYQATPSFTYREGGMVQTTLAFRKVQTDEAFKPSEVRVKQPGGKVKTLKPEDDGLVRFTLRPEKETANHTLRLEYDFENKTHEQFIPIPTVSREYDVSFFPEGGNPVLGTRCRFAFKALSSNGVGEKVTGEVFSSADTTLSLTTFESNTLGMGSFYIQPVKGERYHAVCRNEKGDERRFELPITESANLSLRCVWMRDALNVSVTRPPDTRLPDNMHLIAHCRGILLYNEAWDSGKEFIRFPKEIFPSGVIQFLLTDGELNPLSERLIFNLSDADLAQVSFQTDKSAYKYREHIQAEINLSDTEGNPLEGSFSISVTDDNDVRPDSTQNILTSLLLTSELKGYIEQPAWYLQEGNLPELDHLMLTQGWRRYNIPEVLKGNIEPVKGILEIGPEISGRLTSGFFLQNKGKGYSVSLLSYNPSIFETTEVDEEGRFRFNHIEQPDSTWYIAQALSPKGGKRAELFINEDEFPSVNNHIPQSAMSDLTFETYVQKAEQKYTHDHGIRTIHLPEVSITAKRKKGKSPISVGLDRIITLDEIKQKENSARNLYVYLKSIGSLRVDRDGITWLIAAGGPPLIIIDEIEIEDMEFIYGIRSELIEEIELVRCESAGPLVGRYGTRVAGLGGTGAILITTKARDGGYPQRKGYNKKSFSPLGYQKPKEFYSPRYETDEQMKSVYTDLRTTIYWNPDVCANEEGKADVDFYAADADTFYTVIIEGITNNGIFIRKEEKIRRK